MRVLVAGGAGYVGSHVVRRLIAAGHAPVVVDNLSSGHRQAVGAVPLEVADFTDRATLSRLGDEGRFDAVIHLAAHALVGESVARPERYYRNNLIRSLELLEWIRQTGWGGMVFSSSAAVYGEPQDIPIREDHPTQPTNPYGDTKLAFERALEAYRIAHEIPYVSLRYFNAAGADPTGDIGEDHGSSESHLIPRILQVAGRDLPAVKMFGTDYPTSDGTALRDYVHVCDLADAHVRALAQLARGESGIYNLGNGEGFTVKEVIRVCSKVVGTPIEAVAAPRRMGDPAVLVASSTAARERLGWRPRFPEIDAIMATAWNWHRTHPDGFPRG
ncbi:MAG: UDP-glucose 4-epimerase GalE [Acidobacteriota bacterium]